MKVSHPVGIRTIFRLSRVLEIAVDLPDECATLRLEILSSQEGGACRARIWRLEHFRIQPTFPQDEDGQPAHEESDEVIWKEFEGFELPLVPPTEVTTDEHAETWALKQLEAWVERLRDRDGVQP